MVEEIHMGEIVQAVERVLAERGLSPTRDIVFRFVTGRQYVERDGSYLRRGSYLTAVCEVEKSERAGGGK